MRKILVSFVVSGALFFSGAATGGFASHKLDAVATSFAKRYIYAKCRTPQEDWILNFAYGYVSKPAATAHYMVLADDVCIGALAIDQDLPLIPDRQKADGVAVLVHEAMHMKNMKNNENEAVTECRAMRNYDYTLLRLGAEPEVIDRLMPVMYQRHREYVFRIPVYLLPSCSPPPRYAKWGIYG